MSNLLLNECHPAAHVLLLCLEIPAPCCMIEPTQGDWRVIRSVKSTVVVLNTRGSSINNDCLQFHPHGLLWTDVKNPFNTDEQLKESLGIYGSRSIVRNGKKCEK